MIDHFLGKIKGLADKFFWSMVAFFLVVIGVGLWRFYLINKGKNAPIVQPAAFHIDLDQEGIGAFVASKNGSVYYPTSCKSAGRINEENRLYFATVFEAEGAGYRRSAQCSY